MEKLFKSTRGNQTPIDFYTSILQGIASDGGLLVPDFDFEKKNLEELLSLNYVDLATEIISTFAPSDAKEALHTACNQAYGEGLFCDEVVREFDSCLQFFTNQIAQNVDYINAFEFFYCQIR